MQKRSEYISVCTCLHMHTNKIYKLWQPWQLIHPGSHDTHVVLHCSSKNDCVVIVCCSVRSDLLVMHWGPGNKIHRITLTTSDYLNSSCSSLLLQSPWRHEPLLLLQEHLLSIICLHITSMLHRFPSSCMIASLEWWSLYRWLTHWGYTPSSKKGWSPKYSILLSARFSVVQ